MHGPISTLAALSTALALPIWLVALPPEPARAQQIDLDAVFRCQAPEGDGTAQCLEAREIILNNCTTCHTFVPIVMQSFDQGGWHSLLHRHVEGNRVDQLKAEQVALLEAYLVDNFNGDLPPPELPPALLETWTTY